MKNLAVRHRTTCLPNTRKFLSLSSLHVPLLPGNIVAAVIPIMGRQAPSQNVGTGSGIAESGDDGTCPAGAS